MKPSLPAATILIATVLCASAQADDAEALAKVQAAELAQQTISAAYVATGDSDALRSSCYKQDKAPACFDSAFFARVNALKAKKVSPKTCREFGFANEYFGNGSMPMSVGLAPSKLIGLFQGEVTEIEGQSLVIYNSNTRQNAVVNISKSMVIAAETIVVGSSVLGYGVQTGVSKGRTANGSPVSIALISANCLGAD